jgi:hydroxymethylbilane synthase
MSGVSSLRLGTRGSLLARTQSGQVADALRQAHPELRIELVTISTSGDQMADRSLADAGGKGLFTKELELALLAGQIDLAVHSLKDVPVTMPLVDQTDLIIAAVPARQDPRDVLVSRAARSLHDLKSGMKVGTGSARRRCQILQARPELVIQPLRGNVDTRLKKVELGEYDAIVLALAGLQRVDQFDPSWMHPIDPALMLPAAGQGALALQCRRKDSGVIQILSALNDAATFDAVTAERAVVAELGGDCHSPIAVLATIDNENMALTAAVGGRGGEPPVARAAAAAPKASWSAAVQDVVQKLRRSMPII